MPGIGCRGEENKSSMDFFLNLSKMLSHTHRHKYLCYYLSVGFKDKESDYNEPHLVIQHINHISSCRPLSLFTKVAGISDGSKKDHIP